jgi:hypothetical protein
VAFSQALSDVRTEVIALAGIDGQTGSSGRHSATRLNAVINRSYRELLARAGQLGVEHGRQAATGTLGSAVSGEDFINLDIPATSADVISVDVKNGDCWGTLDPLAWSQRRDPEDYICPPNGVGWWALRNGPSVSGSTLTQGSLAIFPVGLAGYSYTLYTVKQWPGITSDTDIFLLHDGWDQWLINRAVMQVAQRDTNKRTNWDTANAAWTNADAILMSQARRLNRSGIIVPTAYRHGGHRL